MIQKWYCIICDNCGEVINYWQRSSRKDALEAEYEQGDSGCVISSINQYCCKECRDESRERNKRFRKILGGEE